MWTKSLFMATGCLTIPGLLLASCASALAPTPIARSSAPAANSPEPQPPTPTPKPAAGEPKYGGVLTIGQVVEPVTYDLHQETGAQHMFYITPAYK